MDVLTGQVAIVTGGSRGLGKAVAEALLRRGVRTIIDGREVATLEAVADELRKFGNVTAIAGDVAERKHVQHLIEAARAFGRLDLLVNNASTLGEVPLPRVADISHDIFLRLFEVNVFAPIHLIQHALPMMFENPNGAAIVNITSDAGIEAYPGWGGYGASKAALEHFSRVLAAELESSKLRVLVADPGDMNTQMHRDAVPGADPNDLRDPADSACALVRAITEIKAPLERVRLADVVPA